MGILRMEVLTPGEMEKLHQATLEVFEKTGIRVMHGPTREKLAIAGAITEGTDVVRLPGQMVEELLLLAPREAQLAKMNGEILHVGGRNRYYQCVIIDPKIIDFEKGPRPPVLEDVRRLSIIGDALERVSVMRASEYPPSDIPDRIAHLKLLETFATHVTKHFACVPASVESTWQRIALAEILADGATLRQKPVMSLPATMTSPLMMTEDNILILLAAIEKGIPLFDVVCNIAGATSPYSIAGSLVIGNAEALFPILLAQVLKPGHPVIYGYSPSVMDMHSGKYRYYPPEKFLFRLAAAQMGRHYQLPVISGFSGTLVGRYDPQNGMETALFALAAIAGQANLNGSLGSNFNVNGTSEEQIIVGDTLAAMVERLYAGIEMDDFHLGLNTIHNVGPGGQFMTERMTLDLLRSDEFFTGGVLDLTGEHREEDSMMLKAHARAQEIVERHKPAVPEHIVEEVRRFIRKEEAKLGNISTVMY